MKNEVVDQKAKKKHVKFPSVSRLIEFEEAIKNGTEIECIDDIELYCLKLARKIPLENILEDRKEYLKKWWFINENEYTKSLMRKYFCTEKELLNRFSTANKIRRYKEKEVALLSKEQKAKKKCMELPSAKRLIEIEESVKKGTEIECIDDIELYCLNLAKKISLENIIEDREVYLKSWCSLDEFEYIGSLMKKYSCTENEILNRFAIANRIRYYKKKKASVLLKEQKRMVKILNRR